MHLQEQHRKPPKFHNLLNHFLHFHAMTIASNNVNDNDNGNWSWTWNAPFSVSLYRSSSALVDECTSNAFIIVLFGLFCASTSAIKSSPLLSFLIWQIVLELSCVATSRLMTTLSVLLWFTPTHASFIVLILHYVLA